MSLTFLLDKLGEQQLAIPRCTNSPDFRAVVCLGHDPDLVFYRHFLCLTEFAELPLVCVWGCPQSESLHFTSPRVTYEAFASCSAINVDHRVVPV